MAQRSVPRTIKAGVLYDTLKVAVVPDTKFENHESFRVVLANITGADSATHAVTTALGTIRNDDDKPKVSAVDDSVKEPANVTDADSTLTFAVKLDGPSGLSITVNYQTEGISAQPDAGAVKYDYADTAGTLTFAPGETSKTVSVKVHGDNIYEGSAPETVRLKLSGVNANATIGRDTAIGSILDNDAAPILHVDTVTVSEGGTANFTISLIDKNGNPTLSGLPVTATWQTANGTAVAGYDYAGHAATSFSIDALTNSVQVQVATLSDSIANEGVETFKVILTAPVNAVLGDTGLGRITDITPKPQVTINDTIVSEVAGNAIFTIRLDRPSAIDLNLTWGTANNTDKVPTLHARYSGADSNYTAQSNKSITIPAGSRSWSVISIPLNNNLLDEPDTLFYWALIRKALAGDTAFTVKDGIGVGGIIDNDLPPTISITDTTVTEPLNQSSTSVKARFYIKLSAPSAKDVSGTWTTFDGTATSVATSTASADFKAASGTFTIPAGKIADSVLIEVYGDTLDEVSEAFKIKLLTSTNAPIIATDSVGNGTILDEDPLPLIYVRDTVLNEPKTGTITYKLFAYLNRRSSKTVAVDWATVGNVADTAYATAGTDYVAGSGTLTFAPGDTVKTMSVTINSDAIANERVTIDGTTYYELFKLNLTNLVNVSKGDTSAIDTIIDSDGRPFVSIDSVTISEKDSLVQFHISLDIVSAIPVSITYATSYVTAKAGLDYVAKSGTLTIPASKLKDSIGIQFNGDPIHENTETFLLNLFASAQSKFANKTGLGTILDNDLEPTLSIFDSSAQEHTAAGGSATMRFRLKLSAASGLPVTFKWGTADSTAQTILTPYDYVDTGSTMTIRAGLTDTTVSVRILGDSLYEGAEKFKVQLTGLAGATFAANDSVAIGTITDNDSAPKVYIDSQTVREGEIAVFKLRLQRESGLPLTLNWNTLEATAKKDLDFKDTSGTVTIPAGQLTGNVGVRSLADNVSAEGAESFKLVLKNLVNGLVGNDTGLGTILDTNSLPKLSIDSVLNIHEADTVVNFTVTLTGAVSAVPVHVHYATHEGTAMAGGRYADTSGVVTIPAGSRTVKIPVRILNDKIREPDAEFFTLVLDAADSARIAQPIGLASVLDDGDFPTIKVGDADTVTEGGSSVFPVQVVGITKDTVRVWWHTVDGPAKSGIDYVADSGVVTFLPGRTQQSISVKSLSDNIWEPTEGFSIRIDKLAGASGVTSPSDSLAKGWILDDGGAPSVKFLSADTTVREDVADSVPVRIGMSRPASVDIKLTVPRQAGSAKFGTDYTVGLASDTVTIKAGDTTASFKIHVVVDDIDEYDETAVWDLKPIAPVTLGGKYEYILTIQDDDSAPTVGFVKTASEILEGDSVVVAAKLSRRSDKPIEAWYRVSGSATPVLDNDLRKDAHEVFFFKAGDTLKSILVHTVDDNIFEPIETMIFTLDSTANVAIDPLRAHDTVSILNNDSVPTVRFLSSDTTVRENVGTVTFALKLSNPASFPLILNIKSVAGSAVLDSLRRGSDAVLDTISTYTITFAPGDTTGTFSVSILDDGRVESTESFSLQLSGRDLKIGN
ncbi:MAG: Calx-beta domain-containing protein, partial [Fibrobacterota bacterium]